MYEDFTSPSTLHRHPCRPSAVDQAHYGGCSTRRPSTLGLPYLLHCMVEQIVRLHVEDDAAAEENAAASLHRGFLGQSIAPLPRPEVVVGGRGRRRARPRGELVVGYGDVVNAAGDAASLRGPPSGSAAARGSAERSLLDGLPLIGKNRHRCRRVDV